MAAAKVKFPTIDVIRSYFGCSFSRPSHVWYERWAIPTLDKIDAHIKKVLGPCQCESFEYPSTKTPRDDPSVLVIKDTIQVLFECIVALYVKRHQRRICVMFDTSLTLSQFDTSMKAISFPSTLIATGVWGVPSTYPPDVEDLQVTFVYGTSGYLDTPWMFGDRYPLQDCSAKVVYFTH